MRNPVYCVRYYVVPMKSSLLTVRLYSSVMTLVYNDNKYPFVMLLPSSTVHTVEQR